MRKIYILTTFIVDEYYKNIDIQYRHSPIEDKLEALNAFYEIIRKDEKELGRAEDDLTPYRCIKQDLLENGRFVLDLGDKRKKIYMAQTLILRQDFYGDFLPQMEYEV